MIFPATEEVIDAEVLTTKRKRSASRARRRFILILFDWKCFHCGTALIRETMTVDHLRPKSEGGSPTYENLVPACHPCNQRKGSKLPDWKDIERATATWQKVTNTELLHAIFFTTKSKRWGVPLPEGIIQAISFDELANRMSRAEKEARAAVQKTQVIEPTRSVAIYQETAQLGFFMDQCKKTPSPYC